MLIDCLDSYFTFVSAQLTKLNAQVTIDGNLVPQPIGSILQTHDWPQSPVYLSEGAINLLILAMNPRGGTENQTMYEFICQWTWVLIGTNLTSTQQGANRGDRYRNNIQIMQNLRQANFPGFCQKQSITAVDQNLGTITQTPSSSSVPYASLPYNTIETIHWTRPRFTSRMDKDSGIVYGVGALSIFGYEDAEAVLVA
jgi:hypothetical protein